MIDETQMEGRAVADLLPWYANGRLTGRDRQRVAVALASDPALQRELALILEERTASIDANEALGVPSREATDRFFAALDAQAPKTPRFNVAGWVAARLSDWQPRAVAWGAIAAAVLVVAQVGVIGALVSQRATTYAVSSAVSGPGGAVLLVSFEPASSVGAIAQVLESSGASIVAGPLPGGLYQLRIGDHPLTKAEVEAVVARLKAQHNLIRFVAPQSAPD
jgi:anti-sigma factor RsiW